jgi:hypothetical protein
MIYSRCIVLHSTDLRLSMALGLFRDWALTLEPDGLFGKAPQKHTCNVCALCCQALSLGWTGSGFLKSATLSFQLATGDQCEWTCATEVV